MFARSVRPLTVALLSTALGACASHRTYEDEVTHSAEAVRDTLHGLAFTTDEPVELKTTGPLAVNVDNFAGDVEVRANPKALVTTVEVRRVSSMGLGRMDEAREELVDVKWTATLEPRAGGGARLRTYYRVLVKACITFFGHHRVNFCQVFGAVGT